MPQDGGDGMLVTTGGRFGGYGLYLLKGKPVFLYNMLDLAALPLGRRAALWRPASTPGRSISPLMVPALARAARVF